MFSLFDDENYVKAMMFFIFVLGCITLAIYSVKIFKNVPDACTCECVPYIEPTEETLDSLTQKIMEYEPNAIETTYMPYTEVFESEVEECITTTEELPRVIYTGFVLTYYCGCEKCCGKWAQYHTTATGTTPTEGRTIAVDPNVIPYGSIVKINGHDYVAEDTGSSIRGNHIDIYLDSHEEALQRGVETDVTIYVLEKGEIE